MKTVNEVSRQTGVSIRTLHYYDAIGLLRPTQVTEAGYRLYDDTALERLQNILLFRELQFPLREIRAILDSPDFDRKKALDQQIALLQMKKEHIENLIDLARGIRMMGVNNLDFSAFDTRQIDEYARQAKAAWGKTEEYREFEEKNRGRTAAEQRVLGEGLMALFVQFGRLRGMPPAEAAVQAQVGKLRGYITENFYTCTPEILRGLAELYAGGGSMTENIDKAAGDGTAAFVAEAIRAYTA